jgi:hypothetical protein
MQKNDMARKIKIEIGGEEVPNLVHFGAIERNQVTAEVPSFDKLRTIITGVDTIPPIDMGFKYTRDSETKLFWRNWYEKNQIKDVVVIEVDGTGAEIDRITLLQCECSKYTLPEYTGESPAYFRVDITILPNDILELS